MSGEVGLIILCGEHVRVGVGDRVWKTNLPEEAQSQLKTFYAAAKEHRSAKVFESKWLLWMIAVAKKVGDKQLEELCMAEARLISQQSSEWRTELQPCRGRRGRRRESAATTPGVSRTTASSGQGRP